MTIKSNLFLLVIFLFCQQLNGQVVDSCKEYYKINNRIKGTANGLPFFLANGVIVRFKELDKLLIDSVYILKCSQSFVKYKNLANAGIVSIKSRQTFKTFSLNEIEESVKSITEERKVMVTINGLPTEDKTLLISKKAIKRLEILHNVIIADKHMSPDVVVISIWTITRREKRADAKLPKLCRGVGVNTNIFGVSPNVFRPQLVPRK